MMQSTAVSQATVDFEDYDRAEKYRVMGLGVKYILAMAVSGDVAEFGTMTGFTATVLAQALAQFSSSFKQSDIHHAIPPRRLQLFDSFVGLPAIESAVDLNSPHVASKVWGAGGCKGLTAAELLQRCGKYWPTAATTVHDGWFSETLPKLPDSTRFALLHVDCDLYQSTVDVLENVFSRGLVSQGALVLFDDWDCNAANPKMGQRLAWREACTKYAIECSDHGAYGVAGHRFIVHDYRGMSASQRHEDIL